MSKSTTIDAAAILFLNFRGYAKGFKGVYFCFIETAIGRVRLQPFQRLRHVCAVAGSDQSSRAHIPMIVIERMQLVELNPLAKLSLRHGRLKLSNGSPAKGKSEDMPKPFLTLGG
jgi:hypothetical protein